MQLKRKQHKSRNKNLYLLHSRLLPCGQQAYCLNYNLQSAAAVPPTLNSTAKKTPIKIELPRKKPLKLHFQGNQNQREFFELTKTRQQKQKHCFQCSQYCWKIWKKENTQTYCALKSRVLGSLVLLLLLLQLLVL